MQTRGLRVDGRCRSVDVFENLLTLGRQEAVFDACLDAADVWPGDRLLDVGCGSGKLVVAAAERVGNDADLLHGIDPTPGMIDLAEQRSAAEGVEATWQVAAAESLPYDDESFDAVTSSWVFHHLPPDLKRDVAAEARRVLRPGGRFVVADYARPAGIVGHVASVPMRFNFYEYVRPQLRGELERVLEAAGFEEFRVVRRFLGFVAVMRLIK